MAMLKRGLLLLAMIMGSVSGSVAQDSEQETAQDWEQELENELVTTQQRVARLAGRTCALTVEWDSRLTLFENETARVRNDPQKLADPELVRHLEQQDPNWADAQKFAGYVHVLRGLRQDLNSLITHADLLGDRICAAERKLARLKRQERQNRRRALAMFKVAVKDMRRSCSRITGNQAAVAEIIHRHRPPAGGAQEIYDAAAEDFLRGVRRMGPQRSCGGRSTLVTLAETAVDEAWSRHGDVIEGHEMGTQDQRRRWQRDLDLRVQALMHSHVHGSDAGGGTNR